MIEKGIAFHVGFIDLSQTFDRVPKYDKWKALVKLCVKNKAIKSLYNNCRNYVRTTNNKFSEFISKRGVRQGDNLSTLLFIFLLNHVLKEVKERVRNLVVGNYLLRTV